MRWNKFLPAISATLFSFLGIVGVLRADDMDLHKTAGGLSVYLGILPAGVIRDHPQDRMEGKMHGGIPEGSHSHHVIAAVFDAETGERIEDAKVEARVAPLGLAGERQPLEPMEIAGTITYGGYFTIRDDDAYRIKLWIATPGQAQPLVVEFAHEHR